MKLVVTIDTEEDNWGKYNLDSYGAENIKKIDPLQDLFDQYGVKPTYLVTYPIAANEDAVNLLRQIMEDDRCEIGTHCHAWNTPPLEEERNRKNSMLCNLESSLQYRKILTLHDLITNNFGREPTSFRGGRWGYNKDTGHILDQLGYKVDSSAMAYQDWTVNTGPDYSFVSPTVFNLDDNKHFMGNPGSQLIEVPATVGYTRMPFILWNNVWRFIDRNYTSKLHIKGIFHKLGILNKIRLSPENATASEMIKLLTLMKQAGYQVTNMFFHSVSLKAGCGPFVNTEAEEQHFLDKIRDFLCFAKHAGIEPVKLSDVPAYIQAESIP